MVRASVAAAAAAALLAAVYALSQRLVFHPPLPAVGCLLVTGASSGIGKSAALSLAASHPGWTILAGVRREADGAALLAGGAPANVVPLIVDVADDASRAAAAAAIAARPEPLIALINNAGVSRGVPVELHALDDARRVFDVNVFGALGMTQLLLPQLKAARGRIVMVSSVAGRVAMPLGGVYAASKFALEALSDALRRELGGAVSVTVLEPAYVKSAIFDSSSAASSAAGADDAARQAYPQFYKAARAAARAHEISTADDTRVTDAAIESALTDARPLTRVQVARAAGMPASFIVWLVWALPDRLADLVGGST
jgi:NAD(P)-dependent dehydrogenase (short-subunit alcohol dehydrogenase family)